MKPVDVRYLERGAPHHLNVVVRDHRLFVSLDGAAAAAVAAELGPAGAWVIDSTTGRSHVHVFRDGRRILVGFEGAVYEFLPEEASHVASRGLPDREIRAPMTGKVVDVAVEAGDHVEPGATLVVLEAMKMEHRMKATGSMTVVKVHVAKGSLVELGTELVTLVPRVVT